MLRLPANWLKQVRVRELPHDPSFAILLVQFTNEHGQLASLYQTLVGKHGMSAASRLETGLQIMSRIDLANMDPFVSPKVRQTAEAQDQHWAPVDIPNTVNLKDFRLAHGLRDPEEANRA